MKNSKSEILNPKQIPNSKSQIVNWFGVGLVFCLVAVLWFLPPAVNAQTAPQFLVSWQAESYVPSWYQGKIFPTRGTTTEVNFELIDGGKIADLRETKVRWYVNDELLLNEDNGLGIKSLRFRVPDYPGNDTEVRISIPGYNGQGLDKIIRIPVNAPEVAIVNQLQAFQVGAGNNLFEAIPFFFDTPALDNLSFSWFANGERAESSGDRPWLLNLNIGPETPSGFEINLRIVVQNLFEEIEIGRRDVQLRVR